jgi:hypothetical protein
MAVGAVVARILTQYSDKGSKAASKDIAKLGKSFDKFAKKSAKAFGVAAAAAAAFAVKIGKDAVQAAMEDQKSQALLANSLRNTIGASDAQIVSVEKNITALQKQFSVVDDELRPAFGRLTAAFGSTTAANEAMQIALDVSAFASVDLATASNAIIKASQGQSKSLSKLVPGIGAATLATKDFGKITDKVSKIVGGAAATRAGTLEGKLAGLRIAFGEILETLGYALLPVLEKFATTISTRILPQLEAFVAANQEKLAASFAVAAEFAVGFLEVLIKFGDWVVNNTGTVKTLAAIIAGMFVINSVAVFIASLATISASLVALRTLAMTTGIAMSFATGGTSAIAGAVGAAAVVAAVGVSYAANQYGSSLRQADEVTKKVRTKIIPRGNANNRDFSLIPPTGSLNKFENGLNAATAALKKSMNEEINAAAAKKNLARQATLSGSSTIAIGASGSKSFGNRGMNVSVNVAGSVTTENDLITAIADGLQRTSRRSFGSSRFATAIE